MMAHHLANKTIVLNDANEEETGPFGFLLQIKRTKNMIVPAQLLFSRNLQEFLCISGWFLMAVGLIYKLAIFKHIFREQKKKQLSPINILILMLCLVQTFGVLFAQIYETLVVYHGENLKYVTGPIFCLIARFVMGSEIMYSIIGGVGIALYRILLIKCDTWVKYKCGETNLLHLILFSGIALTSGFVITIFCADDLGIINNNCVMTPGSEFLEVVGEYQQSLGRFQSYLYLNQLRRYLGITMVFMTLAELTIYIFFFRHLYIHDNSDTLLSALGATAIKTRNKRNALTFFAQFCSFIFEISFMLLMLLASLATPNKSHAYLLAIFWKKIAFAVVAVLEVRTSRKNLKATLF